MTTFGWRPEHLRLYCLGKYPRHSMQPGFWTTSTRMIFLALETRSVLSLGSVGNRFIDHDRRPVKLDAPPRICLTKKPLAMEQPPSCLLCCCLPLLILSSDHVRFQASKHDRLSVPDIGPTDRERARARSLLCLAASEKSVALTRLERLLNRRTSPTSPWIVCSGSVRHAAGSKEGTF